MVSKFQQVELQLSVNLVDPDQDVILTANLSDLEMAQIKDQDGEIWFVVNGKGDDFEEQSTTNPPTATWPGRPEVGEYRAKVELRFEHGKKRDTIATRASTWSSVQNDSSHSGSRTTTNRSRKAPWSR